MTATLLCSSFSKNIHNILNRNIPWPGVPEELSPETYDLIDHSEKRAWEADIQYVEMKAQFDALLASGVSPCPTVCPPRPPQSLPILHGVYIQYKGVTEEHDSDEDDEDYYMDNAPPFR
ncbi:hypothetical protein P3L10_008696 [Capsicum annuum]